MSTTTGKSTHKTAAGRLARKAMGLALMAGLGMPPAQAQGLAEAMEAWGRRTDSLYHASVWKAEGDTVTMRGWALLEENVTATEALGEVPTRWYLRFTLAIADKDGKRHVDFVPETVERRTVERKDGMPKERVSWQSVRQYCGIDSAEWAERIGGQQRIIDSLLARPRTQLSLKAAQGMEKQIRRQRRRMTALQQQRDHYLEAAPKRRERMDSLGRELREAIGRGVSGH